MADDSNVLFLRDDINKNGESNADDVWDDTALIKAYDKAVNLAKEEVTKRMGLEIQNSQPKQKAQNLKQFRHTSKAHKKWTIGSPCRAIYSGDGKVYEAVISKIYKNSGMCIVKFIGYGNTEKVELSTLLESEGLNSQIAQEKDASAEKSNQNDNEPVYSFHSNTRKTNGTVGENMDYDTEETEPFKQFLPTGSSFSSVHDMIPPAPPLPPQLMAKLPENDADALSSMLMSWYISGFHTGYYHGLKHARDAEKKKTHC